MPRKPKLLECLGGPLCGSEAPDTKELWFVIQRVSDPEEMHYYKRIKMVDFQDGKSLLVWHYHGPDPYGPGVPLLRPNPKKFR